MTSIFKRNDFQPWLYKLKMNEEKVNRSDSTAIRDQVKNSPSFTENTKNTNGNINNSSILR